MYGKKVSLICPIYNEKRFLDKFLCSVLEQDYPWECLEIILIDGMSTDGTRDIAAKYLSKYDNIRLLDNQERTVPYALNKGIREAVGDIIIRLDAHCEYPSDYVSTLVRYLYELNADNVGGVWNTLPAKDTPVCHAIAIASSHPFGVGASMHKVGAKNIMKTDTVPFGCYRRDVFDRIGLFDTELTRNQDDEFNGRLIKNGGSIYLIPQLSINYTARDSLAKMRKMYYQYGMFKPLVNKKLGSPATIRQFVPLLFLLWIVFGGLLGFFSCWGMLAYVSVLLLYVCIGVVIGLGSAVRLRRPLLVLLMPFVFANVHISYGYGYLVGIYKLLAGKSFSAKSNR